MSGSSRPGARGVVSTPSGRGPSGRSATAEGDSTAEANAVRPGAQPPAGPAAGAERTALLEQRDFLLASLDDLDREHDAGDIDEDDYRALRDDYTARAASVLRSLDAPDVASPDDQPPDRARRVRTLGLAAVVVVFAFAAGLGIANNFGGRVPGQTGTGVAPTSNREKVSQAQRLEATGEADALADAAALYDEVLENDPENVDALTYKGWLLVRAGLDEGMDLLDQAIALRPGFAPPHVFKAVGLRNAGEPEAALLELDAVDPTQLSAFAGLVTNLRQELEAQIAAGDTGSGDTPTTTAAP